MAIIYKIFRADEYAELLVNGQTSGAPIDRSDGYIHISTGDQVEVTASKQFAGERGLKLLALESDTLGMAELGVDALVRAIRGEEVASLIDSGAALVTKDNMGEFQ
jgi:uncharacterized protein (DUF952 family)